MDEYFTLVSQSKLFDVPSMQPLRKELLEAAVHYYAGMINERGDDPCWSRIWPLRTCALRRSTTKSTEMMTESPPWRRHWNWSSSCSRDYPDAKNEHERIAGFWKGKRTTKPSTTMPKDPAKVDRTLRKFVALWNRLAVEHPSVVAFQNDLAAAYYTLADWQASEAVIVASPTLAEESLDSSRKAIAIWERLSQNDPKVAEYRENLVMVRRDLPFRLNAANHHPRPMPRPTNRLNRPKSWTPSFQRFHSIRVYLADALDSALDARKRLAN